MGDSGDFQRPQLLVSFIAGAVAAQIVIALAVGLPGLLAVRLSSSSGSASTLIALAAASSLGAVLCAVVGNALGKRAAFSGSFAIGLGFLPAFMAFQLVSALVGKADALGVALVASYVIGGAALTLTFWLAHRRLLSQPQAVS